MVLQVVPLLEALKRLRAELDVVRTDEKALRQLLTSVQRICRIFFSLNSPGLTEVICPPHLKCSTVSSCLPDVRPSFFLAAPLHQGKRLQALHAA